MAHTFFLLITLMVLSLASAFFSGSETALFSLKRSDLMVFRDSGLKREKGLAQIMLNPQQILITILLGNLFANLFITMISTSLLLEVWGNTGHFVSIILVTPLMILFLEIVPKVFALHSSTGFSRSVYYPLQLFHLVVVPFRIVISTITNGIINVMGLRLEHRNITAGELTHVVEESQEEGVLEKGEGTFINNVMRFSRMEGGEVMFPRNKTLFIPETATVNQAVKMLREAGAVRAPVFSGDVDHVTGMIDMRKLLPYFHGFKQAKNIKRLSTTITFFPATRSLTELLDDFLHSGIQIAVLLDEYGGTQGVITLNQILSVIMGKEYNRFEIDQEKDIRYKTGEGTVVSAKMLILDFNDQFGCRLDSIHSDSIGGYLMEIAGGIPGKGEHFTIPGYRLTVKNITGNRLESIQVSVLEDSDVD